jgi:hypothetical protein
VTRNVAVFAIAALLEIAGCFAFWAWLRRAVAPWVLILGITSLIGLALALTRVDTAYALPANAESTRVKTTANAIKLTTPSTATNGEAPRRSDSQKAKQPAISNTAASANRPMFLTRRTAPWARPAAMPPLKRRTWR